MLAALGSPSTRDLLATVDDEPATPSTLAESVDTSIQNVRYQLDSLTGGDPATVMEAGTATAGPSPGLVFFLGGALAVPRSGSRATSLHTANFAFSADGTP